MKGALPGLLRRVRTICSLYRSIVLITHPGKQADFVVVEDTACKFMRLFDWPSVLVAAPFELTTRQVARPLPKRIDTVLRAV